MSKCEICGSPNVRKREGVWICTTHYNQYLEYFLVSTENGFDSVDIKQYIKESKECLSESVSEKIKVTDVTIS